jgi:hypothetical protein
MSLKYNTIRFAAKLIPDQFRIVLRRHFPIPGYDLYLRVKDNPYRYQENEKTFKDSKFKLGIIVEKFQYHKHYITACNELEISYKLIDLFANNWMETIEKSGCDAFLVWPSTYLSVWKQLYEERLYLISNHLNLVVYPSYQEIWLYESKQKVRDWLQLNDIPHPQTWVYYDFDEAIHFIEDAKFPIVLKLNRGASSSGVEIIRNKSIAKKRVRTAFTKGLVGKRQNPTDRQYGSILFQEYLPNVNEWRMVRIGDSFFGHGKERVGEFHSGSKKINWEVPRKEIFDLLLEVTEKGNFTSMDVDIFETEDGKLYVNELQTVFGSSISKDQLRINGQKGRFIFDIEKEDWVFQEGDYSRNACANERIKYLVNRILPATSKKLMDQ